MNKKSSIYIILALCLALLYGIPEAKAQNFWITNDNAAHNLIWNDKIYRQISFLSDTLCAGRATGTRGSSEAGFWIYGKFRKSGLIPFANNSYAQHIYAGKGTVGHNITGFLPGSLTKPADKYIIVCAHYDHLGKLGEKTYPGADSNASGVSVLLNLADMFSAMRKAGRTYTTSLIFVAFDGKEMNMAGSKSFWNMIENGDLKDPVSGETVTKEKIILAINMDQIGSSLSPLSSGRKDYLIMLDGGNLTKSQKETLSLCNRFYGTQLELSDSYYGSENFTRVFYGLSDHKIFADNGIPAVFFTSGITMNTFKTTDTVNTLDIDILRKRTILIYHWIEKMMK